MTVADLNKALADMKEIYPYKDEETNIKIDTDLRSNSSAMMVSTYDKDYGITISMKVIAKSDRSIAYGKN